MGGLIQSFSRRPLPPLAHLKYIIYILGLTRSRTSTRGYNLRFAVHRQYRDAIKAVVCFASGNFFSQLSTLRSYWLRYCHCVFVWCCMGWVWVGYGLGMGW